mgnify:FL=1
MSLSAVAARDKYVKLPPLREDRPLCGCRDRFGPNGMAARQDLAPETAGGGFFLPEPLVFHPSVRYLYRLTETESVMEKVKRYIDEHRERFVEELFSLLRIPSISADSAHRGDMVRCAEHLRDALLSAGADRAEVMPTDGNPIVYGEKIVDSAAPTVLVYGHYDVMPVDPLDEWKTDPFEPVLRDGRIWGRGADDDKGQSFMHVKALEAMISAGELPCNVKFMIEGEEEIGSASITTWCARHKELLRSDVILVSDTSMLGWDVPSITCGLRGLCYVQVTVTGPDRDLHSGLYGGAVADPAVVLSKMIASLTDADGRVTVPGFYDRVRELSPAERTDFGRAPFCEAAFCKSIGVRETAGEKGYSTMERIGVRPSLDVNGIWGGYTGEGAKTIIPSKAHAKISMRLVPDQDYREIGRLFAEHFRSFAPRSVRVDVEVLHGGFPYVCPTDLPAYRAAARAVERTFGRKPLPYYSGGSIPIISTFEKELGVKSVLLGFGLDRDAIHSPNESYGLENFLRGIETIVWFYREFAAGR